MQSLETKSSRPSLEKTGLETETKSPVSITHITIAVWCPFESRVRTHHNCCSGLFEARNFTLQLRPLWKQGTCTLQLLLGPLWKQGAYTVGYSCCWDPFESRVGYLNINLQFLLGAPSMKLKKQSTYTFQCLLGALWKQITFKLQLLLEHFETKVPAQYRFCRWGPLKAEHLLIIYFAVHYMSGQ